MRAIRKFNQILGFYMPSMFLLHVHTEMDIRKWNKWDDATLCTFLHEYIHFLQDISTWAGLYNIYVLGECLADRTNQMYSLPDGKVIAPLPLVQGPNNVLNNQMLSDTLEGDICLNGVDEQVLQVSGKAAITNTPWNLNGQTIIMHEVRVPYFGGGSFVLGNYHISESMAYLAELIVYGNKPNVVQPSPSYPYDIVRQLAFFYSPKLSSNNPLLFTLCDLALCYSSSSYALCEFFDTYVKQGCPDDWRSFVIELKQNLQATGLNGIKTFKDGLYQARDFAIKSLDLKFNHYTYNDIRRWYYNIISRAIEMRLQYPLFLYDFLSGGELKSNKQFLQLLKGIGTPILTNDFSETYFTTKVKGCHLKKRRAEFLIAAGSITYALGLGDFPCELRRICKAGRKCIDKNCVRAPWKHARKVSPCPYGHLWYGWGLKNKELSY